MAFDAATALIWILFLALFPMAFFWYRRAYRIFIGKDYSEVALKKGLPPENPKKWAPVTGSINLSAALVVTWIVIGVPLFIATGISIGPFEKYDSWSAIAGSTIWLKLIIDFIVGRHAHPNTWGKKKEQKQSDNA